MASAYTLAELRQRHPDVPFVAHHRQFLPGNHVALNITKDGIPFIADSISPSTRFNTEGGLMQVRYQIHAGAELRYTFEDMSMDVTVVDPDVEGWVEVRFADGSTAIVRPSRLS